MGLLGAIVRTLVGGVVGALKLPFVIVPAILRGRTPPAFTAGSPLGAALLEEDVAFISSRWPGRPCPPFRDVQLTSADGTKLHAVEDDGSRRAEGRRPIVFVHGFPELWISWRRQLLHYAAQGHPVLALSMRGYGSSAKPAGLAAYDTVPLCDDIRAAVARAAGDGPAKPLLVAHDWGAGVCWSYVSHAAGDETVAGYVSLSNPPTEAFRKGLSSLRQMWASAYMVFFNASLLPEWLLTVGSAWVTALILNDCERGGVEERTMNAYRANVLQEGAMTAQLNYYRAALAGGSEETKRRAKQNRLGAHPGPSPRSPLCRRRRCCCCSCCCSCCSPCPPAQAC